MNELTDLEIKSKLAVIEGHTIEHITGNTVFIFDSNLSDVTGVDEYIDYNPLTDDALCFQLMVKYKLSLIAPEREQEDWDCVIRDVLAVHENPNKAICLAVIEAHKDQS